MSDKELRDVPDLLDEYEISENRIKFEKDLDNMWGYSVRGLESKKAAMSMLSTKTGMYAKIPIVCKGDDCPYKKTCKLLPYDLAPTGEPCPIETSEIELRFNGYCNEFDLEETNSFVDRTLISSLINYDIMIERCKALLADEQKPVNDVVAGVGEDGEPFYRPEVSKSLEALERCDRKRNEIYDMMVATRKSKKGIKGGDGAETISDIIHNAVNQTFVVETKPDNIVDVEDVQSSKDADVNKEE